jgi:hypothetical protein
VARLLAHTILDIFLPLQGKPPAGRDLASVTAQSYQISGPAPVVSMALKSLPESSHLALPGQLLRGELSWNVSPVGQRTPPACTELSSTTAHKPRFGGSRQRAQEKSSVTALPMKRFWSPWTRRLGHVAGSILSQLRLCTLIWLEILRRRSAMSHHFLLSRSAETGVFFETERKTPHSERPTPAHPPQPYEYPPRLD